MARRQTKLEAIRQVVLERIHREGLIPPGAAVLVACSGGADSTALLHILMGLADQAGWRLGVVHVDHGQHPDAASIARLVRARCRRHGLPYHGLALDPQEYPPGSSEADLRQGRYRIFRQVADQERYDRIATGHTASDQAETVLMRLLRGTGPGGLAGIPAEREGLFIRPMLDLDRDQIRDYLRSGRLRWRSDPTNSDPRLLRNRLRLEVLPALRRAVNPAVDRALVRLSRAAARDEQALESLAAQIDIEPLADGGVQVRLVRVRALEAAVQIRVFRRMVTAVAGPGVRLEQQHLERWLEQVARTSRFRLGLQAGLEVFGGSGWLRLAWTRR